MPSPEMSPPPARTSRPPPHVPAPSDSVPALSTAPSGASAPPPAAPARGRVAAVGLLVAALGGAGFVALWWSSRARPPAGDLGAGGPSAHAPAAHGPPELPARVPPEPPARVTLVMDDEDIVPATLAEQRLRLFERMRRELDVPEEAMRRVEEIFAASPVLGQGNPEISRHPMSRSTCRLIRSRAGITHAREPVCGAPGMVPIFDPGRGQRAEDARVCIDQLEFPNIPCEYPVVHVRAREAALLCRALGKRICDAHEWEGACAGAVREPDVEYEWARPRNEAAAHHNAFREKVWSYGATKDHARCGTGSSRTPGCPGGGFERCGSNTYPAGAFPECQSRFGVFDLHGNVAEHMSLPLLPEELARNGDRGFTEMKGSWFAFSTMDVHADDCRWRAPDWHATRIMSEGSHANYHLGFRCCKDVERP